MSVKPASREACATANTAHASSPLSRAGTRVSQSWAGLSVGVLSAAAADAEFSPVRGVAPAPAPAPAAAPAAPVLEEDVSKKAESPEEEAVPEEEEEEEEEGGEGDEGAAWECVNHGRKPAYPG